MPLHTLWGMALFASLLTACHNSTAPQPELPSVLLRVEVVDSSGSPLAGAYVSWRTWPLAPADTLGFFFPFARADSLGRFEQELGQFDDLTLDSIRIESQSPGCDYPQTTLLKAVTLQAGRADTIDVRVVQATVFPRATLQQGQVCALGSDASWGMGAYQIGLRIDSAGPSSVVGRWRINYHWSRGDDYGSFQGTSWTNHLVLDLVDEVPQGQCTGLRLYVPLQQDGTWGPSVVLGSQDCLTDPPVLDFVAGDFFGWFP